VLRRVEICVNREKRTLLKILIEWHPQALPQKKAAANAGTVGDFVGSLPKNGA
jgi:hypothetical protein